MGLLHFLWEAFQAMALYAIESGAFTALAMSQALPMLLAVLLPTIALFAAFIAIMVVTNDANYTNSRCFMSGVGRGLSVAGGIIGALVRSILSGAIGWTIATAASYITTGGCFEGRQFYEKGYIRFKYLNISYDNICFNIEIKYTYFIQDNSINCVYIFMLGIY